MKKSKSNRTAVSAKNIAMALLCSAAAQWSAPLFAANQYWLGDQSDPLFPLVTQGSFFNPGNWNNTLVPGSADSVFLGIDSAGDTFDSGSSNGNFFYTPNYINFGDFESVLSVIPGTPVFIPGGTATIAQVNVAAGNWTFDMGSGSYDAIHNPAASTGGLTITRGLQVSGTNLGTVQK